MTLQFFPFVRNSKNEKKKKKKGVDKNIKNQCMTLFFYKKYDKANSVTVNSKCYFTGHMYENMFEHLKGFFNVIYYYMIRNHNIQTLVGYLGQLKNCELNYERKTKIKHMQRVDHTDH